MPWRRGLQWAWQGAVFLGLALLCLLVLAWLTLQWGILPHIEDWRPAIERHASAAVGVPVRIGHIGVRSSGWVPALELRDVVLRDKSGAEALRLPRVSAALSARSLLVLAPRLSQLYIEDAQLLVRRDVQGHLHVGGLDLGAPAAPGAGGGAEAPVDWFFSQQEFVLRRGTLRWVDEQRDAPALELHDVDIVVRNGYRSHDLRIDATPPPEWGDRFSVRTRARQPLFAQAGDWRRWNGTFYAELPRGDVALLERHVDLPFELDRGRGALRLWLDFRDEQWRALTADVQLRDVGLRLANDLAPLSIVHLGGRLSAERDVEGVRLAAEHFGFETASGVAWPDGNLRVAWRQRQASVAPWRVRHAVVTTARPRASGAADGVAASVALPASAMPAPSAARATSPASGASTASSTSEARLWDAGAPVTGGELAADRLDLAQMRALAAALPLPAIAQRWLANYQPEGVVQGLSARWNGPLEAPTTYRANATIAHFSMAAGAIPAGARNGRPGWRNAGMTLQASETGGTARVSLDGGALELPGVFEEPVIGFDRFAATADWTIAHQRDPAQPAAIAVALRDVHFENADAQGDLQLKWHTGPGAAPPSTAKSARGAAAAPAASSASSALTPPAAVFGRGLRFPGQLDLTGELTHAHAAKLARYVPQSVPQKTRAYLRAAFSTGDMDAVAFTVRGDLAAFPYARHDGEFRIAGHVSGVDLDYVPGVLADDGARAASAWPHFTQVQGQIVLDRGTLEIHDAAGRMDGLSPQGVDGGIPALYQQPVLSLHGQVTGPMTDFLRYVAQSPVGGWLHEGLAAATATGDANLDIALAIPLQHGDATTVTGALTLPGNDVRLVATSPMLVDARARVDFTEHGVTVRSGAARVLGGDATFDGGTQADGSLRFAAQGSIGAEGLRHAADDPMLVRLGADLNGQASYKLQIAIARGQTEFALTSPLTGLGVALPAPLNKPAEAAWPLRVSTVVSFDTQGRPHDVVRTELSRGGEPLFLGEVERDLSGATPRPQRSAYAIGSPLPAPLPGGILQLRGASFDADAWLAFWRVLSAPAPTPLPALPTGTAATAVVPGPGSGPVASAAALSGVPPTVSQGAMVAALQPPADGSPGYLPTAVSLKTPDLLVGGRHLGNVDIQLARVIAGGDEIWRSNVVSDQTKGVVEYRPETPTRGAQLFARLDRLVLDAHDDEADGAAASPQPAAAPSASSTVPALDVVVDSFELNSKKLGKLEASATLQSGGRDWRLTKLALTTPEAKFTGTGRWSGAPARHASLDFKLDLADSGAFLDRLGIQHVLKGGKGQLSGAVAWTGSPLALDYPSLQGKLLLALDAGQFLKADAGAARLLGVLSLQSLPRRLTLDFRDLFQEGFAFDNVTGDVAIDRGVATTKDLRMRGLNAAVLMSGRADLKAETQDLDVIVVPEVNAGAASLAYVAINPIIGVGTFLAQLFLRNPLTEAGTREFHVSGTWSAPKVDPVEHKAAVAAAAEAASQARAAKQAADAAASATAGAAPAP